MRYEFVIPGEPVAKGRPRISSRRGRVRAYTPAKTRAAETSLAFLAKAHRPKEPIPGPVDLTVTFILPIPASWPRKKRAAATLAPHTSKPDLDNLVKLVKDSLTGIFWLDDKQVCRVTASKIYGPTPRTVVVIADAAASPFQ